MKEIRETKEGERGDFILINQFSFWHLYTYIKN